MQPGSVIVNYNIIIDEVEVNSEDLENFDSIEEHISYVVTDEYFMTQLSNHLSRQATRTRILLTPLSSFTPTVRKSKPAINNDSLDSHATIENHNSTSVTETMDYNSSSKENKIYSILVILLYFLLE